jgi:hypothetical protein
LGGANLEVLSWRIGREIGGIGLFREVNKRIREVSDGWGPDRGVEFLCECGREDCIVTFALTEAQFDGLLGNEDRCVFRERAPFGGERPSHRR